jgi:salicylate hydroxylase
MSFKIGILGAGIGGLTAAIALQRWPRVVVYEQSKQFLRVGADINLTPNAVGPGRPGHRRGRAPYRCPSTHRISRTWDSGEETSRLAMGDTAEKNTAHRN